MHPFSIASLLEDTIIPAEPTIIEALADHLVESNPDSMTHLTDLPSFLDESLPNPAIIDSSIIPHNNTDYRSRLLHALRARVVREQQQALEFLKKEWTNPKSPFHAFHSLSDQIDTAIINEKSIRDLADEYESIIKEANANKAFIISHCHYNWQVKCKLQANAILMASPLYSHPVNEPGSQANYNAEGNKILETLEPALIPFFQQRANDHYQFLCKQLVKTSGYFKANKISTDDLKAIKSYHDLKVLVENHPMLKDKDPTIKQYEYNIHALHQWNRICSEDAALIATQLFETNIDLNQCARVLEENNGDSELLKKPLTDLLPSNELPEGKQHLQRLIVDKIIETVVQRYREIRPRKGSDGGGYKLASNDTHHLALPTDLWNHWPTGFNSFADDGAAIKKRSPAVQTGLRENDSPVFSGLFDEKEQQSPRLGTSPLNYFNGYIPHYPIKEETRINKRPKRPTNSITSIAEEMKQHHIDHDSQRNWW